MISFLATLTNAVAGRERDCIRWYTEQHIGDIVRLPGVLNGQFFQIANPENSRWRNHCWFEIEVGRVAEVLAEIERRRGSPDMPTTDSLDASTMVFMTGVSMAEWRAAKGASVDDVATASHRLLTLSNFAGGQGAAFDAWCERQRVPDMLSVPGVVGARRFAIDSWARGTPSPWRRMVTYPVRGGAEPMMTLPAMTPSDTMDRGSEFAALFAAATPRWQANP